jgi:hypothetical protein
MEEKIQKEYIDYGFGFPVRLRHVPMIKVRGSWTPNIDYSLLTRAVLCALAYKPSRLSGNEIRFVRNHFEMTLQAFSKRFCLTHVAVLKWEKSKDNPTLMNWTTEKDIRLFILSKLSKASNELAKLYFALEELPKEKPTPVHVDLQDTA